MPYSSSFNKRISRIIYPVWVLSLCSVAYVSLTPGLAFPAEFWNADKVYHCLAYLWLALLPTFIEQNSRRMFLLSLFLVLFGVILEIGQRYVPGRMVSFADMGANATGVLLGLSTGKLCRKRLDAYMDAKELHNLDKEVT